METNRPSVGIDVANNFCFYATVSPSGTTFLKPFKALNTKQGFLFVLEQYNVPYRIDNLKKSTQ